MKYGRSLIFISTLMIAGCRHDSSDGVVPESKTAAEPKRAGAPNAGPAASAADSDPAGPAKASNRSNEAPRKPPVAARIPGTDEVKSPFSDKTVNVAGMAAGTVLKDPANGKEFTVPENVQTFTSPSVDPADFDVAAAVPGKPGLVLSPSGNIVDVSGIPAGKLVLDPSAPAEADRKIRMFRVPPPSEAAPEEGPAKQ